MARLDARYRRFWTTGRVYRHFWANSGDSGNANANGATVTVVASLVPGAATGTANVSGATIAATASLAAGAGSGAGNASGVNLLDAWHLFPGAATGGANASGQTLTADIELIAPPPVTDGSAPINTRLNARYRHFWGRRRTWRHFWAQYEGGDALTSAGIFIILLSILVEGQATGESNQDGDTLVATVSLESGAATVDAHADGAVLTAAASIVAGAVVSEANVEGQLLTVTTSILRGSFAAGAALAVSATLIPGEAAGTAFATPSALLAQVTLFAGRASVVVYSQTLEVVVLLNDGVPVVPPDVLTFGQRLTVILGLVPGEAVGDASASGDTATVDVSLIEGETVATTPGQTLTVSVSLLPGQATSDTVVPPEPPSIRIGGLGRGVRTEQSRPARAKGKTVRIAARLIEGEARGYEAPPFWSLPPREPPPASIAPTLEEVIGLNATAPGTTVRRHSLMMPGAASGGAGAGGVTIVTDLYMGDEDELMMLELV